PGIARGPSEIRDRVVEIAEARMNVASLEKELGRRPRTCDDAVVVGERIEELAGRREKPRSSQDVVRKARSLDEIVQEAEGNIGGNRLRRLLGLDRRSCSSRDTKLER